MVDYPGLRFWIPISLCCLLALIGINISSPHKRPVLYWISAVAMITVPIGVFGLVLLIAFSFRKMHRRHRRRHANRHQATAVVAAVYEHTLEPELREPPNTNGVHSFHIASLPTYIYDKEAVESGPICPICKELFGKGDIVIQLPLCIHSFHKDCIEEWLERKLTCPVCRYRVDIEIPSDIALIIDQ